MPRDIPVGNGRVLVNFDRDYQVRDIYYPHVGKDNQTGGGPCKIGVWADGEFSWMGPEWDKTLKYRENSLVTDVVARNDRLGIELHFADCVDYEDPVFVREIRARDLRGSHRDLRIFFHHDFNLYGHSDHDTACYDPQTRGVVHFKHRRYCLVNVSTLARFGADHYVVGEKGIPGKEGTWRDAEDGQLSGNAAASGSVDSTIGVNLPLQPNGEQVCYMWIAFGVKYNEVKAYNSIVWEDTPGELIRRTHNFWTTWLNKEEMNLHSLPENVRKQFLRSLLIVRAQSNLDGGIISSSDSEARRPDNDLYSYVWPREAGITALGLDAAGYTDMVRTFYPFCAGSQADEGFMLPKYFADGAMGPLPHPWVRDGARSLPIQEDETAILIYGLWKHFERYRDFDFIDPLYHGFIVNAAEFMAQHIDHDTHLPLGSYDLWEERFGVHTGTAAMVAAGLWAASKFARAFGDIELALKCNTIGDRIKAAMVTYLYHNDLRRFARSACKKDGAYELDMTPDSAMVALWAAGVFSPDDPRIVTTVEQLRQHLTVHTDIGGIARYQGDPFHRVSDELPGNPWLVPTMWMAQWDILRATNVDQLKAVLPQLEWVCHRALPSGVLPEQVNPYTGEPISATPSTFAHGKFVHEVMLYLEKLEAFQPEVSHRRKPRVEMKIYEMAHISTEEIRRTTPEVVVP